MKTRIVVVFGETTKALGLLAGRVASGRGGINKGSMVSVVKALRNQRSTAEDSSSPGIVLANVGQLYWWPDEKRALTVGASANIPLPSLVHSGRKTVRELNGIEGHETPARHVQYVFDEVLGKLAGRNALVDVVAVGDTCTLVEKFLDERKNWDVWGHRLSSVLLMDTILEAESLGNPAFQSFLAKVCTSHTASSAKLTPIALSLLPSLPRCSRPSAGTPNRKPIPLYPTPRCSLLLFLRAQSHRMHLHHGSQTSTGLPPTQCFVPESGKRDHHCHT